MPTPASTTRRAPLVSNLMPRGLLRPVAISWAFHPGATTGGEYAGVRVVAHAEADVVVSGGLPVVAPGSCEFAPREHSNRAAVAARFTKCFMVSQVFTTSNSYMSGSGRQRRRWGEASLSLSLSLSLLCEGRPSRDASRRQPISAKYLAGPELSRPDARSLEPHEGHRPGGKLRPDFPSGWFHLGARLRCRCPIALASDFRRRAQYLPAHADVIAIGFGSRLRRDAVSGRDGTARIMHVLYPPC